MLLHLRSCRFLSPPTFVTDELRRSWLSADLRSYHCPREPGCPYCTPAFTLPRRSDDSAILDLPPLRWNRLEKLEDRSLDASRGAPRAAAGEPRRELLLATRCKVAPSSSRSAALSLSMLTHRPGNLGEGGGRLALYCNYAAGLFPRQRPALPAPSWPRFVGWPRLSSYSLIIPRMLSTKKSLMPSVTRTPSLDRAFSCRMQICTRIHRGGLPLEFSADL